MNIELSLGIPQAITDIEMDQIPLDYTIGLSSCPGVLSSFQVCLCFLTGCMRWPCLAYVGSQVAPATCTLGLGRATWAEKELLVFTWHVQKERTDYRSGTSKVETSM